MTLLAFHGLNVVVIAVMYSVFLLRRSSDHAPFIGHGIFTALLIWAFGNTGALYAVGQQYVAADITVMLLSLNNALKLSLLGLFFYMFAKRNINIPVALIATWSVGVIGILMGESRLFPALLSLWMVNFGGIFLCFSLLMFVERIYQLGRGQKMKNRHLVISFGLLAIIDMLAYVGKLIQAYGPLQVLDVQVAALLALSPFIYRGINSMQTIPVRLSLSRPVAFQSFLFMSMGVYLCMIALLGYLLAFFGLRVDTHTQLIIAAVAVMPMIYALVSQRMRSSAWVWINKHFFANQFDYRQTWLSMTKKWDPAATPQDAAENGLSVMLAALAHTHGAVYRVKRNRRLVCMADKGMLLSEQACQQMKIIAEQVQDAGWIVDINDLHHSPDRYSMINQPCDALYKAGVKWLVPAKQGGRLTTLVIIGNDSHQSWTLNWEMRDFMNVMAQQTDSYIHSQIKQKELSEHAQMAAFHQTSAFVIHDLKNVYAQLGMLNKNAEIHQGNPDFVKDAFLTTQSMEHRMQHMLSKLTNKQSQLSYKSSINVFRALRDVVMSDELQNHAVVPVLLDECGPGTPVVNLDEERLKSVMRNLIDNAQHACDKKENPNVLIRCGATPDNVIISVSDNGSGMSQEFMNTKLFRLFETTKGNAGMGLGMYDAKCFVEEIDGEIDVASKPAKGTTITLSLPRS